MVFHAYPQGIVTCATVRRTGLYVVRETARVGRGETHRGTVGRQARQSRRRRPRIDQRGVVGRRIAVNHFAVTAYRRVFGFEIRRRVRINGYRNRIRGETARRRGLRHDISMRAVGRDAHRRAAVRQRTVFERMPCVNMGRIFLLATVQGRQRDAVAVTDMVVGTRLRRRQRQHFHLNTFGRGTTAAVPARHLVPSRDFGRHPRHRIPFGAQHFADAHKAVHDGIPYRERTRIEVVPKRVIDNARRVVRRTGRQIGNGHPSGVVMPVGRVVFVTPIVTVGRIVARRVQRVPAVAFRTVRRYADAVAIADRRIGHDAQEVHRFQFRNDNRLAERFLLPQTAVARRHTHLDFIAGFEQVIGRTENRVVQTAVVIQLTVDIPVVNRLVALPMRFGREINIRRTVVHTHVVPRRIRFRTMVERYVTLIRISRRLIGRDVVNAIVVQIVNHAVGDFNAQAVAGLVRAEAAFVNALFIYFEITAAGVGGEFDIVVIGIFRMLGLGRQTDHEVRIRIADHTADRTVVENQLLGRGAGIPMTVAVKRRVAAVQRQVVIVAPRNRLLDNRVAPQRVGMLLRQNERRLVRQDINRRIHFHDIARYRTFVVNRHAERERISRGQRIVQGFQHAEVTVFARLGRVSDGRERLTYFYTVLIPLVFGCLARILGGSLQRKGRVFADSVARNGAYRHLRIGHLVVAEFEDIGTCRRVLDAGVVSVINDIHLVARGEPVDIGRIAGTLYFRERGLTRTADKPFETTRRIVRRRMRLINRHRIVGAYRQPLVGVDGHGGRRHIGNLGDEILRTYGTPRHALFGARIFEMDIGILLESAVGKQRIAAPDLAVDQPFEFGRLTGFGHMGRERIETLVAFGDEQRIAVVVAAVIHGQFGRRDLFLINDDAVATVALQVQRRNIDIVNRHAIDRLAKRLVGVHARVAADKAARAVRIFLALAPRIVGVNVRTRVETDFVTLADNRIGHLRDHGFRRKQDAVVAEATVTVGTVNEIVERIERADVNHAVGIAHGRQAVGRAGNRVAVENAGAAAGTARFVRIRFPLAVETVEPFVFHRIGRHEFHLRAEAERRIFTRRNNLDFRDINRRRQRIGKRQMRRHAIDGRRQARPNRIAGLQVRRGELQAVGRQELIHNRIDAHRFGLGHRRIVNLIVSHFIGRSRNRLAVHIPVNRRPAAAVEHRIDAERKHRADTSRHRIRAHIDTRFERFGRINGKDRRRVGTATVGLTDHAVVRRVLDRIRGVSTAQSGQFLPVSAQRIVRRLPQVRIHLQIRHGVSAGRIEAYVIFADDGADQGVFINLDRLYIAGIGTAVAEHEPAEMTRLADFTRYHISGIAVFARAIRKLTGGGSRFLPQIVELTVAAFGNPETGYLHIFLFGAKRLTRSRNHIGQIIVRPYRNRIGRHKVADPVGHLRAYITVRAIRRARQNGFRRRLEVTRGAERRPVGTVGRILPVGARARIAVQAHKRAVAGAERRIVGRHEAGFRQSVYPDIVGEPQRIGRRRRAGSPVDHRDAVTYRPVFRRDAERRNIQTAAVVVRMQTHVRRFGRGGRSRPVDHVVSKRIIAAAARNQSFEVGRIADTERVFVAPQRSLERTAYHRHLDIVGSGTAHGIRGRQRIDRRRFHTAGHELERFIPVYRSRNVRTRPSIYIR